MPFKSAKQRRYLYSQKPEVAKKFAMDSAKKGKMLKLRRGGPQDYGQEAAAKTKGADNVPDSNPYSTTAQEKNKALNKRVSERHSSNSSGTTTGGTTTGGTTTGGATTGNKNFVQNIGYNIKEKTKDILGINKKEKTKNLNDLAITTREIGIKNQYTKDAANRS